MKQMDTEYIHQNLTKRIIAVFYEVYSELGYGFLEKVYENAMVIALKCKGMNCQTQKKINVVFRGEKVGEYYSDLIVDDSVIAELKACETLVSEHEYQLINYLRATQIEVGLLLNFGKKPEIRRKVFTNDRKPNQVKQ
jgi:GxxExxY protein